MAMDAKQRKTMITRIAGGVVIALIIIGVVYWLFSGTTATEKASPLGPSDPMAPTAPVVAPPQQGGQIVLNPTAIQFQPDTQASATFMIQALGQPMTINDVVMPTTDADALTVQSIDCPSPPAQLPAGSSCVASVTWNASRTVNSTITIKAATANTGGAPVEVTNSIAVTATSTKAPPPPGQAAGTAGGVGAASAPNSQQVDQLPQQASASQNGSAGVPSGPSMREQMQGSYQQQRRSGLTGIMPSQLQPAARSPYTSWNNIGVQGATSSYPVNMTRVITPDKPITAVLSVAIDTRQTVTAVAMVDRDVYGNNGRTVVIPRGSKLIGKVSGAAERVGIAWSQVLRPDGVRFLFTGESGDSAGRGGVPGKVNERLLQRYGYSLLPSLVSGGITLGLGGQTTTSTGVGGTTENQDAKAVASQILQQPLQQIAQDIYQRKSQMPIQITVPQGTRITVWSVGDLRLKPMGESDEAQTPGGQGAGATGTPGRSQDINGGFNRGNGTASTAGRNYATQAPAQAETADDDGAEDGSASLSVGTVDANGNYIPPGGSAPAPGPIVTNTNNGVKNATGSANTTFNANKAPWQQ